MSYITDIEAFVITVQLRWTGQAMCCAWVITDYQGHFLQWIGGRHTFSRWTAKAL